MKYTWLGRWWTVTTWTDHRGVGIRWHRYDGWRLMFWKWEIWTK